jgi:predicted DNA-binding protein with PD1-like motif
MLKADVGQICFIRMFEGDDLLDTIKRSAEQCGVKAGVFTLIGALKNVVMGCYKNGEYVYTRLDGPMEIASCMGNIAVDEKGEAFGGHLMKDSLVGPTAELMIIEASGADLRRLFEEKTKLKLLKLS